MSKLAPNAATEMSWWIDAMKIDAANPIIVEEERGEGKEEREGSGMVPFEALSLSYWIINKHLDH